MFADRTNWNLASNRLAEALARHRASDRKLLDLSASNPTDCGFHYDQPAIMRALQGSEILEYHPDPCGLVSAREAVCDYYAAIGVPLAPKDMILTTSTSEAYSFAFRLLANPGDEILIPAPSYPLFDFLADIQDVKLQPYSLFYDHGWHVDFHTLEQRLTARTRAIIVVHPNNPTGHFTKPAEIARLNQLCSAREVAIIADEVFLDFSLDTANPATFAGNRDALTFTMSGISKISGLPQMKLAWLTVNGPDSQRREALSRLEVIADTYLSLNTPIQLAAPILLEQRHAFQQQLMQRVRENLRELDGQLSGQSYVARLEIEGGWYAVLRIPAVGSDEDAAVTLLENDDVYVHPGHFYGFPGDGFLVVSLITSVRQFHTGTERLLARLAQ